MSWETYVVGSLEFKPGLPEEKKAAILEDFAEVLETELAWDARFKEYKFSSLNWSSHVREEDIKKCYQKHKRRISLVSISLWYLTDADFSIYVDESMYELGFGSWPPLNSKKTIPALDYLFDTLMPPGRVRARGA